MNQIATAAFAACIAGAIGAVLALNLGTRSDENALEPKGAERFEILQNRLKIVENELEDTRRKLEIASGSDHASRGELMRLRKDFEALEKRLGSAPMAAAEGVEVADAGGVPEGASKVAEIVDRRLEEIETARREAAREKRQRQRELKIRTRAVERSRFYQKRLQLNSDQTERLEEAYAEVMPVLDPLYGAVKGSDGATPDDRLAAIQRIRETRSDFHTRVQGIMDASQYEGFREHSGRESQKVDGWLDHVEGEIRGTPPAGR